MPRGDTYADNAYNRRMGRAGAPMGSCVISKGSSSPSSSSYSGAAAAPRSSSSYSSYRTESGHSSALSYRTNPVGNSSYSNYSTYSPSPQTPQRTSMPPASFPSPKTYKDNAMNRKLGRVGLEIGTAVHSKNNNSSSIKSSSNHLNESGFGATPQTAQTTSTAVFSASTKTYVDNALNRKLGRVGLEHGTAVHSKNDNSSSIKSSSNNLNESRISATPQTAQTTSTAVFSASTKTYVDNALNRKLGRVGLPIGTAVYSRKTGIIKAKEYVDNSKNRSLGRVGLPRGSAPESLIKNNEAEKEPEIPVRTKPHYLKDDFNVDNTWKNIEMPTFDSGSYFEDLEPVMPLYEQTQRRIERKSSPCFDDFEEVNKKDVKLLEKIGEGGFGEVWKAEWKNKTVALKKLRVQRVSKNRLKDLKAEVTLFCTLQHENIVTFFGACLITPDVCIVMELMEMSLFEALHEQDDIDFTEDDLLSIMLQTAAGLCYLHGKKIAHCDFKTANVLLNYFSDEEGSLCEVKITDFGLSIMKSSIETSQSSLKQSPIGTPLYSAPEVLRGELLSVSQIQVADIYSLGLVFYEIVYMKEPFYNMSFQQLCKQVGEKGLTPEIPRTIGVSGDVLDLLNGCWAFDPDKRMISNQVQREVKNLTYIFE